MSPVLCQEKLANLDPLATSIDIGKGIYYDFNPVYTKLLFVFLIVSVSIFSVIN